ncbi:uncharacterized protein LOC116337832 [Contarinia nasturtii]|uniref:uncharacterized protein LOC116337832 n=1 Tax=Contarinia nasturtii TaxID=265458 RepID=UPI0012D3DAD0|nr:uncharacterized protein LOC116337832 [Contarinia nasturtii]
MSHKKDRMKTSKLSSTVLDYYYKYGQNRDLEKYLRMRRSTSKSSSDSSSLKNYESGSYSYDSKRNAKSLEKLNSSDCKSKSKDDSARRATKSQENVCESGDGLHDRGKSTDTSQIKIEKKTQQRFKGKSKSKSYNLNLESSIEINLPSSTSLPTLPITQIIDSVPEPARILQLESTETQTDVIATKSITKPSILVEETPPAASKLATQSGSERNKQTTHDSIQETSPASSVASAKVRLEWDSMADIGYNRIIDFKSQSNSNLTTFERSALTKFFAKRGLNFDDNLLILAPPECKSKSPLQKREFTQSAIEMRDAQKIRKDTPNLSPATSKRLWESALEKYREKYRHSKVDTANAVDTTQFMSFSAAPHHSTPLPVDTDNSSQYNNESISRNKPKSTELIPIEKPKTEQIEKWSQTSSIHVEAIGIQVEQPQIAYASKSVQIEIEQVHESTQKDDEDLTTATSFEFVAPNAYKNQQIAPLLDESTASEIPSRIEIKNDSIYIQEENPDDKENIPPIDDKENIPPPPLHAMHRNDPKPSVYKTPENAVEKRNESCVLPNDLQKGVDLINALIDSRTTDGVTKKKLIRKIVRHLLKSRDTKDITQMIMSYSDKSSTKISGVSSMEDSEQSEIERAVKDTISGISALSSSSSLDSVQSNQLPVNNEKIEGGSEKRAEDVKRKEMENKNEERKEEDLIHSEVKKGSNDEKEVKDWLLPITQSEIEKEIARKTQIIESIESKDIPSVQRVTEPMKIVEKPTKNNEIFEFLEHEKKTHFNWIDQEIEHLKNLKVLLQNLNTNDSDESKGNVSDEKINSVYAKHNREYLTIYENFRRNAKHSSVNGSQADVSSTLIDSSKSTEDSSHFINHGKMGSKSHWIHKTTLESPPSTISSGSKEQRPSRESAKLPVKLKEPHKNPEWDSHLNMQLAKNRTKLKTPNSDEESIEQGIEAYAKACRAKFDRKYAQTQVERTKKLMSNKNTQDQPIYTKPYSSDSYSDIQNIQRMNKNRMKAKQNDAYTSVSGSDGFLSPNSISIGVAANSTSNTTTHQYDSKISIGLQTTNTLKRMPIIQLKKAVDEPTENEPESQEQPTVRVKKLMMNKQLQVRPEALAYVIIFQENQNDDHNANTKATNGKECGNQLYANTNKMQSTNRNSDSSDLKTATNNQRSVGQEQTTRFRGQNSSNDSSIVSADDNLTLQEYLQTRRPDFYANAEQRRKCLNDLHNLRQQRNEQRKKLFATNICTNAKTLNRNMKRLLPPPPLAQMRIFKSRDIISQTRRKYKKLPEILKRQQMERETKIRRNHRILVNMFSKNLQKHVLRGKTDLSNSMMIN